MTQVTTAGRLRALGILVESNALPFAANAALVDALADAAEMGGVSIASLAWSMGIPRDAALKAAEALQVQPLHTGPGS